MAFLDSLADRCFKTDGKGRIIFYRSGLLWGLRGYIVPDEFRKQQIHRFVRHYRIVSSIALMIGLFLLTLVLDIPTEGNPWWMIWVGVICLGFVCQVWYFLSTARLVRGLPTTDVKYPLRERLNDSAKSTHIAFWWILLASFMLFTGLGVVALLKGAVYAGLACIALFACFLMMTGYMIWLKKRGSSYDGVEDETQQNL